MNLLARLSERDRRAVMLLAPAVLLILLVRLVVLPVWDFAAEASAQIASKEKMLHKYRMAAESVPMHETTAASLTAALTEAHKGLLGGTSASLQSAELQQTVRDLATNAGISLRSVDFAQPKNLGEDYVVHGVTTQFLGGIDQVVAFLTALQSAPRILSVDQLRLSSVNVPASATAAGKKQVSVYIAISGVAAAPPPVAQTPANAGGK